MASKSWRARKAGWPNFSTRAVSSWTVRPKRFDSAGFIGHPILFDYRGRIEVGTRRSDTALWCMQVWLWAGREDSLTPRLNVKSLFFSNEDDQVTRWKRCVTIEHLLMAKPGFSEDPRSAILETVAHG